MRVTVKIKKPDDKSERDFHLFDHQVARFVAKIEADGGTARIVPLALGADLVAMLTRAGVNAAAVR